MSIFADRLGDLSSERLNLRILDRADAPQLQTMTNDRSITDIISFLEYPFTVEDSALLIERFTSDQDRAYGAWTKESEELVALIGAHSQESGRVEIGYWVGVDFQGKGYAYEAGAALVLALVKSVPEFDIFAECLPDNIPSQRLLEKLGFLATEVDGARAGRKVFTYKKRD